MHTLKFEADFKGDGVPHLQASTVGKVEMETGQGCDPSSAKSTEPTLEKRAVQSLGLGGFSAQVGWIGV